MKANNRLARNLLLGLVTILAGGITSGSANDFPVLAGPYLGQELPGLIPKQFVPSIAPPEDHKHSAPAFSPDGTEMFFSVYENYDYPQKIKVMRLVDGVWTAPELAPFSGVYQEGGPVFSPDGNRLYFYSKRPRRAGGEQTEDSDIWFVARTTTGWSEPINIGGPINTDESSEHVFAFSPGGNLVFSLSADRSRTLLEYPLDPTTGLAAQVNDRLTGPQPYDGPSLPAGSFSTGVDYCAGGNVVVVHTFALDGSPSGLFISKRRSDGTWPELTLMGDMLNRGGARFNAFSPDQKYMFFLSYRTGPEEIFWVDATIIDTILTHDLNLVDRFVDIIHNEGSPAARTLWDKLQPQHEAYYLFDHELLGTAGDQLLFRGDKASATLAYDLNGELFPNMFGLLDRLKLALALNDSSAFDEAANGIPSPTDSTAQSIETALNALGYQFIRAGLSDEAIRVMRLNVESFPASGNVFDSYAEALLIAGDTTASIANYRQSLKVDSSNTNARTVLQNLGVE
jgi:hypothetical protein